MCIINPMFLVVTFEHTKNVLILSFFFWIQFWTEVFQKSENERISSSADKTFTSYICFVLLTYDEIKQQ